MSRIEVVYSASRNLYPYLMASVMSLLDHNPDARVWLLIEDDELPYEVPENVELVNVSAQTIFKPGSVNMRTGFTYLALMRATYSKLYTGELNNFGVRTLPRLDRIIQLDCDTIICDSLQDVWDMDLAGAWFAAVPDNPAPYRPWGDHKYYNIGFCLFNLDQIRQDGADDDVINELNTRPMQFVDEMAWNKLNMDLGYTKSIDLPARYNQTTEVDQTLSPAVIHYAGAKEWWKGCENRYRGNYMLAYSRYFHLSSDLSSENELRNRAQKLSSINWIMRIGEKGRVRYIMQCGDALVMARTEDVRDALRRLPPKRVRISDRFPGFPLTVDDKFFFEGEWEEVGETLDREEE